jgi:hypothetical protein
MAEVDMWRLLHLLNIHGPTLSRAAIRKAGITCDPDTLHPLVSSGAVEPDRKVGGMMKRFLPSTWQSVS